jgi:hypothetical protein
LRQQNVGTPQPQKTNTNSEIFSGNQQDNLSDAAQRNSKENQTNPKGILRFHFLYTFKGDHCQFLFSCLKQKKATPLKCDLQERIKECKRSMLESDTKINKIVFYSFTFSIGGMPDDSQID